MINGHVIPSDKLDFTSFKPTPLFIPFHIFWCEIHQYNVDAEQNSFKCCFPLTKYVVQPGVLKNKRIVHFKMDQLYGYFTTHRRGTQITMWLVLFYSNNCQTGRAGSSLWDVKWIKYSRKLSISDRPDLIPLRVLTIDVLDAEWVLV